MAVRLASEWLMASYSLVGDALGSLVDFQSPDEIRRSYPDGVRMLIKTGSYNSEGVYKGGRAGK